VLSWLAGFDVEFPYGTELDIVRTEVSTLGFTMSDRSEPMITIPTRTAKLDRTRPMPLRQ
jgi:hypothetical protein